MKTLTMKFGGTSVGSTDAIRSTIEIVRSAKEQAENVVVIVSAMSGVTNLLEEGVRSAASGNGERHREIAQNLLDLHCKTASELLFPQGHLANTPAAEAEYTRVLDQITSFIEDYRRFCDSVRVLGEATPRALDYTMGLGERMNARLVAAVMRRAGIKAQVFDTTELVVTDDNFQSASPLWDRTQEKIDSLLRPALEQGIVPIATGFVGATVDGISTTLGRGGSDYSGAILGKCLDSDEVWIWTDVDGVMSADPRVVPQARTIETLGYKEISELAYFGAKVLHPKTIRPVLEAGIALRVKNTFNPTHSGTLIVENGIKADGGVKAVTAIRDLSLITVEGKGMLGVPGIAARTFSSVARTGASVLMISQSSSEQSICFVVLQKGATNIVKALNDEFSQEIARRDIDEIVARDHVSVITVVGAGMREQPGVAGRIFTATGGAEVNVIAITQGSSECSISMVVEAADADQGVRAIHKLTETTTETI
jgi:bifunctional aspartokinase / homoserine dehydrogenase 1